MAGGFFLIVFSDEFYGNQSRHFMEMWTKHWGHYTRQIKLKIGKVRPFSDKEKHHLITHLKDKLYYGHTSFFINKTLEQKAGLWAEHCCFSHHSAVLFSLLPLFLGDGASGLSSRQLSQPSMRGRREWKLLSPTHSLPPASDKDFLQTAVGQQHGHRRIKVMSTQDKNQS